MFKIIGAAIVILSATIFGMSRYNALFERKKTLFEILDGARKIKSKLSCMQMPLHESFMDCGAFFEKSATRIIDGSAPSEAINDVASELYSLKNEDIKIIERFASGLCASSCEGQLSNLSFFTQEIEKNLADADTQLSRKGTLYVKGSILAAAAVVLILI